MSIEKIQKTQYIVVEIKNYRKNTQFIYFEKDKNHCKYLAFKDKI